MEDWKRVSLEMERKYRPMLAEQQRQQKQKALEEQQRQGRTYSTATPAGRAKLLELLKRRGISGTSYLHAAMGMGIVGPSSARRPR